MIKRLCILGSTGSIGCSTLDVVRLNPQDFSVEVLVANNSIDAIFGQCIEFKPKYAVLADEQSAKELTALVENAGINCQVLGGIEAANQAANLCPVDITVAAIVGAAGLIPTLTAVEAGQRVLLANKEALVISGELMTRAARQSGALLMPVDSEHNAIFQCLPIDTSGQISMAGVSRILLTGSGGPFRTLPLDQLSKVTPEQAVAHPNWDMGKKISVDSATMMNKGLELIEACYLFAVESHRIDIVIHPQSIIHSMVSYDDGSVLAQLGRPDMRTPIAHCLAWPERMTSGVQALDVFAMGSLTFESPDLTRFPALRLARQVSEQLGSMPCAMNAANEVAVTAFLRGEIAFTRIVEVVEEVLRRHNNQVVGSIEQLLAIDEQCRHMAMQLCRGK